MKQQKPILHNRDHEHGGTDVVRIAWEDVAGGGGGSGGSSGLPSFALTGNNFPAVSSADTPVYLDIIEGGGTFHYSTIDGATFGYDAITGHAQILVPGLYQIGLQLMIGGGGTNASDALAQIALRYEDDKGYSIEVPYLLSGSWPAAGGVGEQILGTYFHWPAGIAAGLDVALQRIHPISLTDATTFPLDITPWFNTDAVSITPFWLAVWGFRISDPLDAYHSD